MRIKGTDSLSILVVFLFLLIAAVPSSNQSILVAKAVEKAVGNGGGGRGTRTIGPACVKTALLL